jgi:hypothetical protein
MKINRNTNLNAQIQVEGKNVIYLNATINEVGSVTTGKTVQELELYRANKEEVDSQVADFMREVEKVEQEIIGGIVNE